MRQIFFDTETTGLDWKAGDRVVEIGALEVIDRVATGRVFHRYLNPEDRCVDLEAESITKLSQEFLKQQPLFREVWPEFKQFLVGADQLIAHNAEFDIAFLDSEIAKLEPQAISLGKQFKVIDSLAVARSKFPGQRNSLDALCKRYKIDLSQRKSEGHGALLDSELLYMVYSALTAGEQELLNFDDIDTDGEMSELSLGLTDATGKINLLVMKAGEQELQAHREMLCKLKESSKSKQVIWSDKYGA